MKYFLLCTIIISLFWWDDRLIESHATSVTEPLKDMLEAFEAAGLQADEAQITIKETMTIDDVQAFLQSIEGFTFKAQQTEQGTMKYSANRRESNHQDETLLLVQTQQNSQNYQLVYHMTNTSFTESMKKTYRQKITQVTKVLFSENMQSFACISASKNGIINVDSVLKNFTKRLNIQWMNKTEEMNFYTRTGYTSRWQQTVPSEENNMNVQFAVREGLAEKTTITLGTPILVHEY
ncbi:hypothetical protein J416_10016 [Gracilibacillus halophilus YIM-C55.5]|uniref:TATA-box binding n=1 Tax=Gracilibacillus halophilus YIM-C55.5 TaxID=1308866 RepID=N4WBF4_9BACI|nr:YwmB family TATA-box binding protein [Gracilibacillus halophilus]ENH96559.1 hypothetical protein J416_10016 [Gracilibacillus halophilus YIM-C55.5]